MIIRLTSLFFFFTAISSCSHEQKIEHYKLNEKINERLSEVLSSDSLAFSNFNFCDLLPQTNWDSVLVIQPYTSMDKIKSLDLSNSHEIESELRGISLTDHKIGILFIEENAINLYSLLDTRLRFSSVSSFTKEECRNLRLIQKSYEGTPYYVITLNN